jgi:hypothetical protein
VGDDLGGRQQNGLTKRLRSVLAGETEQKEIDLYNRHWLYHRPQDMYQVGLAQWLEKACGSEE